MWSTSGQPYLPGPPPRTVRYARCSRSSAAQTGPAVEQAAPRGRHGAHPPPGAEQGAGDRGDRVGVVADADRGGERVDEVAARPAPRREPACG